MSEYSQLIQMITALTNRLNDIEINGKKIDELNQLSTLNPSSKIHVSVGGQSFYVEVSQLIDAISNANHDHIVSINGDITVVGDLVTVPEIVWILSNIIYQTSVSTSFTIPYCATGLNRKDIFVLNASNQVVRIAGPEDADIVIKPNVPIGTLYLTEIDVSDSTVGSPTEPITGTQFIKKQEYAETAIEGTGEITINLTGESTAFRILSNTIAKIKGFNASAEFMSQIFYIGKEIRLINDSGTDIILNHNDTSTAWPFRFPTEVDFVCKNKHVVIFRPTKTDAQYLEFQSVSIDKLPPDSREQIEIGLSTSISSDWHGKIILFTSSCTITVPSSLIKDFAFEWITLAGVTVTWAITSPKTWLFGSPAATPEKKTGAFMQRGSTNSIILMT